MNRAQCHLSSTNRNRKGSTNLFPEIGYALLGYGAEEAIGSGAGRPRVNDRAANFCANGSTGMG